MRYNFTRTLFKLLAAGLFLSSALVGSAAADSWTVLSAAGGLASGDNVTVEFSLGQPLAAFYESTSDQIYGGFLQTFGPSSCCQGITGDFDGSGSAVPDIGDLVGLVEWLFDGGAPPVCYAEANIDGDLGGVADISDVVRLVDFMFFAGAAPAACR